MEWLSHSQKKYCELCKTPFRFTKLYHPHMPSRLPAAVFLRRAVWHLLSHMLTWLRALLVAFVWIVCLPWCMRSAWSMMFWMGDAGWARDRLVNETAISEWMEEHAGIRRTAAAVVDGNATIYADSNGGNCPILGLPCHWDGKLTITATFAEPLSFRFFKAVGKQFLRAFAYGEVGSAIFDTASQTDHHTPSIIRRSSLLSDVPFLRHLFPSPYANRLLIDVIEGQIITLSVVVAFILVFLIREWVVQQQPVIDLAAAEEDNALAEAGGRAHQEPVEHEAAAQDIDQGQPARNEHDAEVEHDPKQREEPHLEGGGEIAPGEAPMDSTSHLIDPDPGVTTTLSSPQADDIEDASGESDSEPSAASPSSPRPQMPARERSFIATEIRRHLEEGHLTDDASRRNIARASTSRFAEHLEEERSQGSTSTGSWQHVDRNTDGHAITPEEGIEVRGAYELAGRVNRRVGRNVAVVEVTRDGAGRIRARVEVQREFWNTLTREQIEDAFRVPSASQKELDRRAVHNVERHGKLYWFFGNDIDRLTANADAEDHLTTVGEFVAQDNVQDNPFHPDYLGPQFDQPAEPVALAAEQTRAEQPVHVPSIFDRICDYFWGDIDADRTGDTTDSSDSSDDDDAHVVEELADEAPFVPVVDGHRLLHGEEPEDEAPPLPEVQDPEVAAAAAQAGVDINDDDGDPDDVEDLEGILELIGMQGPLIGLFQNALFSAVLIAATVTAAVFLPYLWGKLTLLALARPMLVLQIPLGLVTTVVDFIIDIGFAFGWTVMVVLTGIYDSLGLVVNLPFKERVGALFAAAWKSTESAWPRALHSGFLNAPRTEDLLFFSIESHAALQWLEGKASLCMAELSHSVLSLVDYLSEPHSLTTVTAMLHPLILHQTVATLLTTLSDIASYLITYIFTGASLQVYHTTPEGVTFSPLLPHWTATDRLIATLTGYTLLLTASIVYTSYLAPIFTHHERLHQIEASLIDFLRQAGGVCKVIFIISIEMIVFPLFCGILLTIALSPLFPNGYLGTQEGSSVSFPRWFAFAVEDLGSYGERPLTTLFLSWFLGTAYMFHFALFVSLCRRIMRPGVLYFIRDPDDPSFHPVRDVLERSVWGQLRKIGFSACVYGALILGALGGVVWGVKLLGDGLGGGILPIRWSSWGKHGKNGSLEFPLDVLFYNFLTPVVVRVARPSEGLQRMYRWWFRQCARSLRLSSFLFGERMGDEEGRHVSKTWTAWLGQGKMHLQPTAGNEGKSKEDVTFVPNGRFVRAPASDAVRIPKGQPVFVPVDSANKRLDNKPEDGIYKADSPMVKMVYVPPLFKLRIAAFVILVWLFAAVTGVGITIVPLLCGRAMITGAFGGSEDINDIYAFTLGIYTLGGLLYLARSTPRLFRSIRTRLPQRFTVNLIAVGSTLLSAAKLLKQLTSTLYVYTAFTLLIPLLLSLLLELYVLLPLHSFLASSPNHPGEVESGNTHLQSHTINLVQTWTLGLLYTRLLARYVLHHRQAIPVAADNPPAGGDAPDFNAANVDAANGAGEAEVQDDRPGLVRRHDIDGGAGVAGRVRRRNRLGEAARRVFRADGANLLRPNARLATRYFVLPAVLLFVAFAALPPVTARSLLWALRTFGIDTSSPDAVWAARASYPIALTALAAVWMGTKVRKGLGRWAGVVRDEVYLVGERLHNYGESRRRRERKGKAPVRNGELRVWSGDGETFNDERRMTYGELDARLAESHRPVTPAGGGNERG